MYNAAPSGSAVLFGLPEYSGQACLDLIANAGQQPADPDFPSGP
ncbi:hypothetical protein ACVW0Y_001648 [Pseudomonas sp. TE3786]